MDGLVLDYKESLEAGLFKQSEMENMEPLVNAAHNTLHDRLANGGEFLGWVDLPAGRKEDELGGIIEIARRIRDCCDALVIVGIGGSYVGVRAIVEMFGHTFHNATCRNRKKKIPEIYFAGHNLSSSYLSELLEVLEGKDVYLLVISKSGTTLETSIAFKVLREHLEAQYGEEGCKNRIIAITDPKDGLLRNIATEKGYAILNIPQNVGGRYSIFSSVGLLPMAVMGVNIHRFLLGGEDAYYCYTAPQLAENSCYRYAAIRNLLYNRGKTLEVLAIYQPKFSYFAEWWKQLYSESEGKDNKGIFAATANYTTDLHSMGQYMQDGLRNLFETVIVIDTPQADITLQASEKDIDELNFIAGEKLGEINKKALRGTLSAHIKGGVPNIMVKIPEIDEYSIGWLMYFFEKACAISGYLLGVNPFDQPGVQEYKKEMHRLLKNNIS